MDNDDWMLEDEESPPLISWLKKHWETIALNIIVWSLLIIAICSIIQLIIALKYR